MWGNLHSIENSATHSQCIYHLDFIFYKNLYPDCGLCVDFVWTASSYVVTDEYFNYFKQVCKNS